MEVSAVEIGVWWWWHGGQFLGLVLTVGVVVWWQGWWHGGSWWWWHGGKAGVWIGAVIDSHRGGDCLFGC